MTEFEKVETENVSVHRGDDKIPRDHLGRYRLPDPDTGKVKSWTRVTTVAEVLKDRRGLEKWGQRNIIYGIGQRPALYAQAAAAKLTDRETLDGIAKRASEAADAQAGADIGSALHTFTERVDRGEHFEIHEPFAADIRAYRLALDLAGITTALGWIERPLFVPVGDGHALVGTTDRVNNAMEWRLPRIGDVKTATDKPDAKDDTKMVNTILRYGMVDIPLQLAMYAHATHWWDVETEQWAEMLPVDQDKAMVFHVPAGLGECRIYEIDIAAGWEAVQLAMAERAWRRRRDLYETVIWVDGKRADEIEAKRTKNDSPEGKAEDLMAALEKSFNEAKVARAARGGEGDQASTEDVESPKGDEAVSFPVDDSPASEDTPSPSVPLLCRECTMDDDPAPWCDCLRGETCKGPCRWRAHSPERCPRFAWVAERVDAIKAHESAEATANGLSPRKRLAGLWSLRPEIPTFPKGGPRDADELSAVAGMCDLVEMEYGMPFGPPDPAATQVGPTPAEKRRAEHDEAEAAKQRAMSKARNRKRTTKGTKT